MEKQRIIRKLADIANDISLLDIEVTADEIQAEMAKIGGVTDEFSRGYATAVADIPRAVKQAREKKVGKNHEKR